MGLSRMCSFICISHTSSFWACSEYIQSMIQVCFHLVRHWHVSTRDTLTNAQNALLFSLHALTCMRCCIVPCECWSCHNRVQLCNAWPRLIEVLQQYVVQRSRYCFCLLCLATSHSSLRNIPCRCTLSIPCPCHLVHALSRTIEACIRHDETNNHMCD